MKNQELLATMQEKRQRCIVYTRVMGYHRPVESFNLGKTGEHKQRKQFTEC
jgi:anaerobic ribonucleoside-triphosphate reductase